MVESFRMAGTDEQKSNPVSFANVNELFSSYEDNILPMTFPARIAQAGVNMSTPPSELKWHPFLQNRNGNNPRFYDDSEEEFYQVFNFYYPSTYTSYMGGMMATYLNSYISSYSLPDEPDARTLDTAATPEEVLRSLDTPWVRNMFENNTGTIVKVPDSDGTYYGWQSESYFICSDGYPVKNGCITFRLAFGNLSYSVSGYSTDQSAAAFNDVEYRVDKMPSVHAEELITVPVCDCIAKFPIIDEEGGGEEVNVYPRYILRQQFEGDESHEFKHTHPIEPIEEEDAEDIAIAADDYKSYIHDDYATWTVGGHEFNVAFTPLYWLDERGEKVYARAVTRIVAKYKGIVRPAIRAVWYDYLQRCLLYAIGHSPTGDVTRAEGTAWKESVESREGESSPLALTNQPYNRFDNSAYWYGDLIGPKMMGALGGGLVADSVPGSDTTASPVTPGERFTPAYNRVGAVGGASDAPEPCFDGLLEIVSVDDLDLPWYGGSNDQICKTPYYKTYAAEYNQLKDLIEFIKDNKYDENTTDPEVVMAGGAAYAYAYDTQYSDIVIYHEDPPASCGYYDFGINGCAEKETREIMRLDEELPTSLNAYTGAWVDSFAGTRTDGASYRIPVNCYQSEAGNPESYYLETLQSTVWAVLEAPMRKPVTAAFYDNTNYKDDEIRYSELKIAYQCYPPEAGSGELILPCGDYVDASVDCQQNSAYRNRVYLTAEITGKTLDRGLYTGYSYDYSYSTDYSYSYDYSYIIDYTCEYSYSYSYSYYSDYSYVTVYTCEYVYSYSYSYSTYSFMVEHAFNCLLGTESDHCQSLKAYNAYVELPDCWDCNICPVSQIAIDAFGTLDRSGYPTNIHDFATDVCALGAMAEGTISYVGEQEIECYSEYSYSYSYYTCYSYSYVDYTCYTAYSTAIEYSTEIVTYSGPEIEYPYVCAYAKNHGINACRSRWHPWVSTHQDYSQYEKHWFNKPESDPDRDPMLYGICPASLAILDTTGHMKTSPFGKSDRYYINMTAAMQYGGTSFPGSNYFDDDGCHFAGEFDTTPKYDVYGKQVVNYKIECKEEVEYSYEYSYSYYSCYPLIYSYSYSYSYSYYTCYTYEYSYSYSYSYSYEYSYSYSVEYTAYSRNKMPRNIDIYLGIS